MGEKNWTWVQNPWTCLGCTCTVECATGSIGGLTGPVDTSLNHSSSSLGLYLVSSFRPQWRLLLQCQAVVENNGGLGKTSSKQHKAKKKERENHS